MTKTKDTAKPFVLCIQASDVLEPDVVSSVSSDGKLVQVYADNYPTFNLVKCAKSLTEAGARVFTADERKELFSNNKQARAWIVKQLPNVEIDRIYLVNVGA